MKRILIVLDDQVYEDIKQVKDDNGHTWDQCLLAYADAYKVEL
jgi:hypothetical protein